MTVELDLDSLDLLNITINLKDGSQREFNVKEELRISKSTLNDNFIEQPGKYAWWAAIAETAKYQRDYYEAELDKAEATADYNVRLKLELDGIKTTETLVKQNIRLEEDYQKALQEYNVAKKNAAILDKVVKAFDQRLESLISLGANLRKEEMNADVSIKEQQAKVRDMMSK